MKLIYSELKKLLPNLNVEPQKLRDDLTLIGHFANYYESLPNQDFVIDLDIKVNRGDALGYFGLAKDLSVFYQTELVLPQTYPIPQTSYELPIEIKSSDVRRVQSIKISNVNVTNSPQWLIDFLSTHGINSINNIVDITNYVMLIFGIPNHAFDTSKTTDNLIWENRNFPSFTTLDGTTVELKEDNLVITNGHTPLCLSFIGGNNSGIDSQTSEIILEMATYNRSRVRRDSRYHKIITEAGVRLEKDLDSNLIPQAFNFLVSKIIEIAGGEISSNLYDWYPKTETPTQIVFNPQSPTEFSGIQIPTEFATTTLTKLGCQIDGQLITPPSIRKDLNIPEDLVEEVVRFYGYNHIPINQPLTKVSYPDITPPILYLIESLKDKLTQLGYDEVRSWPVVETPIDPNTAVKTQNSINAEKIYLRQSIIQSLIIQQDQYQRLKLPQPQFFEIGKIFSQSNNQFTEHYSLGIYHYNPKQLIKDIDLLGLENAQLQDSYAEIILDGQSNIDTYTPKLTNSKSVELSNQIISMDANVESNKSPEDLINEYSSKIDTSILWQIVITDHFNNRYTLRVYYYNTDNDNAKKIHFETFGIKEN